MIWINYGVLLINLWFIKLKNVTKLGQHLTLVFGIGNVKACLALQRSDKLNPVYTSTFGWNFLNANMGVEGCIY